MLLITTSRLLFWAQTLLPIRIRLHQSQLLKLFPKDQSPANNGRVDHLEPTTDSIRYSKPALVQTHCLQCLHQDTIKSQCESSIQLEVERDPMGVYDIIKEQPKHC
mmetsp:Transcript_3549/g.10382  ORF Transcript_3549/g.10382 Transcript_3549/m.10382 type:complete len:106 (+) Transcript_3549:2970-3287(+)